MPHRLRDGFPQALPVISQGPQPPVGAIDRTLDGGV